MRIGARLLSGVMGVVLAGVLVPLGRHCGEPSRVGAKRQADNRD